MIKSGDRIFLGTGCATPRTLALALENGDYIPTSIAHVPHLVKDVICDPAVISKNNKMVSVTQAQAVDLMGLCNVDYEKEMAFVVTHGERENEKIIGSSFYVVDPSNNMADVAYMILREWQGMGLGTMLQHRMAKFAESKGVKGFTADILVGNPTMLKLVQKCGKMTTKIVEDAYEVEMLFD